MIRCIQIGRTTIQGRVSATYPDPTGEHGAILSNGRVVMGRLIPQERPAPERVRRDPLEAAARIAKRFDASMRILSRGECND